MATAQPFSTGLTKITNTFAPMIEQQLTGNGVNMDAYSKQCVINAISAINTVLDSKLIEWNDPQLDRNNITQILMNVAALKLNAAASPREVYFQLRNVSFKKKENGKDVTVWRKQVEMGIEGDGNDAILSHFGRDVEKVYPYWLVREKDPFKYPRFRGVEYEPPEWEQTGKGDVVRVVYPVLHKDKTLHYYIAERDDVQKNLIAHVNNSMMNETFGILPAGKSRFDANSEQRKQIQARKSEILNRVKELGLASLDDPDLQQYISPAWSEHHSRESMLIRKMRNNVVKKIPKDFGNAFIEMVHNEATDSEYIEVQREIAENANGEIIDLNNPGRKAEDEAEQSPPASSSSHSNVEQPRKEQASPPLAAEQSPSANADDDDFSDDVPSIASMNAEGPDF